MAESLHIRERYDGQIVDVLIGPPPSNILTMALVDELAAVFDGLDKAHPHCKVIVVEGQGDHFGYGASIEEHRADQIRDVLPRFHRAIGKLLECEVPTIAKVSGYCLGGSFELAMACSMICCDRTAVFGLPEIRLGLFPPVASVLLPAKIGEAIACQMILSGRDHTVDELFSVGLINGVCEGGALDQKVDRLIENEILPKSRTALRYACRAARGTMVDHYYSRIVEVEKLYLDGVMLTADANEGIDAFLKKRTPDWSNK